MKQSSFAISNQELTFVEFNDSKLHSYKTYPLDNKQQATQLLMDVAKKNSLYNSKCSVTLQPDQYKIYILEKANVQDSETRAAIKCQLQAKIKQNIDDLLFDYIEVPNINGSNKNKIITFVTEKQVVYEIMDTAAQCGLSLANVTIADISALNVLEQYMRANNKQDKIVVFYYGCNNSVSNSVSKIATNRIVVYYQGKIYLFRDIKLFNIKNIDYHLYQEIKRSINYIKSNYNLKGQVQLVLSKSEIDYQRIKRQMAVDNSCDITVLDFNKALKNRFDLSIAEQQKLLLTAGAVYIG